MRHILAGLVFAAIGFGGQSARAQSVVVVELYTSQGCSSCPAADEILTEVAARPEVLALGLHVDYWDYLGWQDELARPEFTERQAKFNTIMKSRYRQVTPQMIFNGRDYVAGAHKAKAVKYIDMLSKEPETAKISLERAGDAVEITVSPAADGSAPADVHLVGYVPAIDVSIKRGENAGRKIRYTNTVRSWQTVAHWDGDAPMTVTHSLGEGDEFAVIVQTENLGPVQVARRLQ